MIQFENKIVSNININLQNNEVDITFKTDKYATKCEVIKMPIPNMYDLTNGILNGIIENELITNYGYTDVYDVWHEPTWNYRFYVTNEQIAFLTANYFNLVQSLYTEPINPKVQLSEGILVYANSIEPTAVPLFESLGINIETK
jgi:hypothetical protein